MFMVKINISKRQRKVHLQSACFTGVRALTEGKARDPGKKEIMHEVLAFRAIHYSGGAERGRDCLKCHGWRGRGRAEMGP